jgi:hypothetical protein
MKENFEGRMVPNAELLMTMQVKLRIELDWSADSYAAYRSFLRLCEDNADLFLDVLDLATRPLSTFPRGAKALDELDDLLTRGGSAWMVAPDRRSLVRRVQPELMQAAREVIPTAGRAGEYLAEAWRHTYGRNPSAGYREAVRAVEAVACPVIIPDNPKPTLGLAISAFRDAPPGKYATAFEDNAQDFKPLDAIRGLMGLVWTNQLDRHGTADENTPLHVSSDQAEAVLFAAVTLVQWFHRRFVRPAGV